MQSHHPLVSVIIPVYNEEKYLTFCLSSLEKQTYKNIETILIDDGSTDKSLEIAKTYKTIILTQKHQGVGIARNYGAKHAKGEILVFLDADMKYDRFYIEKLIDPIIKSNVIGTFHKEEYVANSENVWADCWRINSDLPRNRRLPLSLPDETSVFRAIKTSYFKKAGGFNFKKGYFDDSTISEKLHLQSLGVPGAKAYHFNPESLSEVYYSSRWIGRGMKHCRTAANFFRYSFFNSLRNAVRKIWKGAPLEYLVFKTVYDFGMFQGIFFNGGIEK